MRATVLFSDSRDHHTFASMGAITISAALFGDLVFLPALLAKFARPKKTPGNFYTISSYRRAVERACKKADVENWSPNQLRHSAGTKVRREFGIEAASVLLGHATTNSTEIYAEKNQQLAANIARALG